MHSFSEANKTLKIGKIHVKNDKEYILFVGSILIILIFCYWLIKIFQRILLDWIINCFKRNDRSPPAYLANESVEIGNPGNLSSITEVLTRYGSSTNSPPPYEPPPPYCIAINMTESSVMQEGYKSINEPPPYQ